MSGSIYEGYKDALRRGHVAALRGRLDAALVAYRDAARIAPDRALPHVGLGDVLARLERRDEALAAYKTALDRSPDEEAALRGRADVLASVGRPAEAAGSLDRLAGVLEAAGRLADACDVARRALELAESRGRRRLVQTLAARLRETSGDPAAADALARALSVLETDPVAARAAPAAPDAAAEADDPSGASGPEPALPATVLPRPDPAVLGRAFEEALDAGDFDAARKDAVATASAYRMAGQFHASIDACYDALAIAPADPGVHFMLAQLYLDRGWQALAVDKLVLVGRLAQLNGDAATRARLCDLVARRFPDDARLAALCA